MQPVIQRDRPRWLAQHLKEDVLAGIIVGLLVIPQSLGYAVLAGLPPIYGVYASILPAIAYALIGASRSQAVGPVAITSLMTAQALAIAGAGQSIATVTALAAVLAVMTGGILLAAGVLRLGWLTQWMSRGVIAGFITASAVLIILGQLRYVLGLSGPKQFLAHLAHAVFNPSHWLHPETALLGLGTVGILGMARWRLAEGLQWLSLTPTQSAWLVRVFPLAVVIIMTAASHFGNWAQYGIAVVGKLEHGGLAFVFPPVPDLGQVMHLLPSAGLIALIGFISSAAVAQEYALRRKEFFDPNRELIGLGLANLTAGISRGFPVTGGFSRTAIAVEAGAQTPLAGAFSALVMATILLFFTDFLKDLPYAVLGAGVIVAVSGLIDVRTLVQAWKSDRKDAWAYLVTLIGVVLFGLQAGLLAGVLLSFALILQRSSQPHCAVIGLYDQHGHFRNVLRYAVKTWPGVLILRIDERLFFGNTVAVRRFVEAQLQAYPDTRELIVSLSGVNDIDLSAQHMLQQLREDLQQRHIGMSLTEIRATVSDALRKSPIWNLFEGRIFLSTLDAVIAMTTVPSQEPEYHL